MARKESKGKGYHGDPEGHRLCAKGQKVPWADVNKDSEAVIQGYDKEDLEDLHRSRSDKAIAMDESIQADEVVQINDEEGVIKWLKNPNQLDIQDIDTAIRELEEDLKEKEEKIEELEEEKEEADTEEEKEEIQEELDLTFEKTEEGEIKKIVHQEIDITDMKRGKKELKKSKRLFNSIFNDPKMFVGILDLDGNLVRANKTSMKFIDSSFEEIKGEPFDETPWWDHSEKLQDILKEAIEDAKRSRIVNFQAKHKNDEGEEVTADFSLRPVFNEDGEITRLVAYGKNIEYD